MFSALDSGASGLDSIPGRRHWARSIRPKFPKIPVQNRMEQKFSGNLFRKFRFTSRRCPFFWKFGNSGNFLFHLAFLPGLNRPSSFSGEKLQDGGESFESTLHWMQNDLPQFEPVLDRKQKRQDLISWKIVDWSFRVFCGSVCPVCILSCEKSS